MAEKTIFDALALGTQPGFTALWGTVAMCAELHRAGLIDKQAMTRVAAAMNAQARDAEELNGGPMSWTVKLREFLEDWSA